MRYVVALKAMARWSIVLILAGMLVSVVGFSWIPYLPSYTQRSLHELRYLNSFASPQLVNVLEWMNANTSPDAVIAAWWEHGSLINLVANRSTIIDDEQIPYWIHLMARHLMLGQDEQHLLEFLASHHATHVLLSTEYLRILSIIGYMGSGVQRERFFALPVFEFNHMDVTGANRTKYHYTLPNMHLLMHEPLRVNDQIYSPGDWRIQGIMLQCEPSLTDLLPRHFDASVIVQVRDQTAPILLRPEQTLWNRKDIPLESESSPLPAIPGTLLCSGDATKLTQVRIGFLSQTARQSFIVRLLVLGEIPPYLKKIYPPPGTSENGYSLWEIEYPPGISKNPDVITADFPPGPLSDDWLHGRSMPPTMDESGDPDFYLDRPSE